MAAALNRAATKWPIPPHTAERHRKEGWLLLALVVVGLMLGGCGSISDAAGVVRERLAAREEVKLRRYAAEPRATYDALRIAAGQMGYRFVRGGPAQGEFEAVSAVRAGESHGSARQLSLKIRLQAAHDGSGTDVAVRLTELIEPDSSNRPGQATELALRDTPQYEVLFQRITQVLESRK